MGYFTHLKGVHIYRPALMACFYSHTRTENKSYVKSQQGVYPFHLVAGYRGIDKRAKWMVILNVNLSTPLLKSDHFLAYSSSFLFLNSSSATDWPTICVVGSCTLTDPSRSYSMYL